MSIINTLCSCSWWLILVNIVTADGADVILVEPRPDAVDVKVMLASQEEDLLPLCIGLQADGTLAVRVLFYHCFNGDRT